MGCQPTRACGIVTSLMGKAPLGSVVGSLIAITIVAVLSSIWPWFQENSQVVVMAAFGAVGLAVGSFFAYGVRQAVRGIEDAATMLMALEREKRTRMMNIELVVEQIHKILTGVETKRRSDQ